MEGGFDLNGELPKRIHPRNRLTIGRMAEDAALAYLQTLGYVLVIRNWRCRTGEIDHIMRDGETLVFIEVRSRTTPSRYGSAIEAITPRKCRQVRETASVYLRLHGVEDRPLRFDVVAVTFQMDGSVDELKHIKAAF